MWKNHQRFRLSLITASAAVLETIPSTAWAEAQTPTISGNAWVALMIIVVLVAFIYFMIAGAMHLEKRDARLGNRSDRKNDGWFGIFPANQPDDEDAPDFHHTNGGDGDGGNGSSN